MLGRYQMHTGAYEDAEKSLERSYFETVEALSSALEAKDAYTLDHARSITDMSADVGRRLGAAPPLVLIGRRTPATPADLPANVSMFESWTHADVLHAWSRALFGLAPSIWREPCATVLMEGMSFGKPMIATRLGGNTDIIEHGRSGLLVTPEDPDDLASAMDALLADEALRLHLADGARKRIPLFRASGVVSQIERVYGDVLAQTSAAYVGA